MPQEPYFKAKSPLQHGQLYALMHGVIMFVHSTTHLGNKTLKFTDSLSLPRSFRAD